MGAAIFLLVTRVTNDQAGIVGKFWNIKGQERIPSQAGVGQEITPREDSGKHLRRRSRVPISASGQA